MLVEPIEPDLCYLADVLQEMANISDDQAVLLVKTAVCLSALQTEMAELEKKRQTLCRQPICTGSCLSTERNAHGGVRFRVLHGKDVSCPLHGTPASGKRLRTRIRIREVDWVRSAIQRRQQCETLETEIIYLRRRISEVEKIMQKSNSLAKQLIANSLQLQEK